MDRPNQSFDDVLRGGSLSEGDEAPRAPIRGTGASNGGFAVAAWSTAALFCAAAAAVVLTFSIRDDEAALTVGLSIALQLLTLAFLICGAASAASVDGSRWPSGATIAVVALVSIGLLAWAYLAVAAGSAYVP